MNLETAIGIILAASAMGVVVALTFWCRSIIDRIHHRSLGSLREIQQEIMDGS